MQEVKSKRRRSRAEIEQLVAEYEASGLAVELAGGRRIEVGRGFDADTLKRLLAVVERD